MTQSRKPLLTKPAGVLVQILGFFAILAGVVMLPGGGYRTVAGVFLSASAIGLFWLGRQTKPRHM